MSPSDTGGNATWTDEVPVTVLPDSAPPQVVQVNPLDGSNAYSVASVSAGFSEPLDTTTLNADSFLLWEAGVDGAPGTGDDIPVPSISVTYLDSADVALMDLSQALPGGL